MCVNISVCVCVVKSHAPECGQAESGHVKSAQWTSLVYEMSSFHTLLFFISIYFVHCHCSYLNVQKVNVCSSVLRCQCSAQYEGPECQQTKHSFHGNGYAWFAPMRPCFESHVSLELITEAADGLLLYSGPLAPLQPWEHEDFMAIGTKHLLTQHSDTCGVYVCYVLPLQYMYGVCISLVREDSTYDGRFFT